MCPPRHLRRTSLYQSRKRECILTRLEDILPSSSRCDRKTLRINAFHGGDAKLLAFLGDEEGAQGNALGQVLQEHLRTAAEPTTAVGGALVNAKSWELLLYVLITCILHFNR